MAEQFVKRKGRREIQTSSFSLQLDCEDYLEHGAERHVRATKNISKSIELKDYINTQLVGAD